MALLAFAPHAASLRRLGRHAGPLLAACLCAVALGARAHVDLPVNSGSGPQTTQNGSSAGWMASLDGLTGWVPVQAAYPNAFTTPDPNTTSATLMWYPVPGGDGTDGPDTVFFRNEFTLDFNGTQSLGSLKIAADDWARVWINGHFWGEYLLTDHLLPNGQPEVLDLSVALIQPYLNFGSNELFIEAHDGGAVAWNRVFEYLFVDGMAMDRPSLVSAIAEPGTLWLAAIAFLGSWRVLAQGRRPGG